MTTKLAMPLLLVFLATAAAVTNGRLPLVVSFDELVNLADTMANAFQFAPTSSLLALIAEIFGRASKRQEIHASTQAPLRSGF
jgi:branched-subunit amino acid transport protein